MINTALNWATRIIKRKRSIDGTDNSFKNTENILPGGMDSFSMLGNSGTLKYIVVANRSWNTPKQKNGARNPPNFQKIIITDYNDHCLIFNVAYILALLVKFCSYIKQNGTQYRSTWNSTYRGKMNKSLHFAGMRVERTITITWYSLA